MSTYRLYQFEKRLREDVIARSEEEARTALTWGGEEWELIDVRDAEVGGTVEVNTTEVDTLNRTREAGL